MNRFILGAGLALLIAIGTPAAALAADAWLLDTSVAGAPKANVKATLTYTDPTIGKQVTVKYTTGSVKVFIERNVDGEEGKHNTSLTIAMGTGTSLNLNAGMQGSGLKVGSKTTLETAINPETDIEFPFQFGDSVSHTMAATSVMASSAEGSYTETLDKSGVPTGPIKLSVTYTVVGNLDVTNFPAKITVKVSASNVQPAP